MAEWHYTSGGAQAGPVSSADLKNLAKSGQLQPNDLLWKEGMSDWVPASKIKGLFEGAAAPSASAEVPAAEPSASMTSPSSAYQPAAAAPVGVIGYDTGGAGAPVTPRSVEMLRQTRPWVILFSVVIFIMCGLVVVGALVMMLGGLAFGGGRGGAAGAVMALFYLAFAALYFFPGLFLWRYGSHIRQLVATHRAGDLESALEAQKAFWKFVGILTIIVLAIYAVVIVFVLLAAGMGAMG